MGRLSTASSGYQVILDWRARCLPAAPTRGRRSAPAVAIRQPRARCTGPARAPVPGPGPHAV